MKLNLLKVSAVALFVGMVFVNCESDDVASVVDEGLTIEDVAVVEEIDAVIEDINTDVEQIFFLEEELGSLSAKTGFEKNVTDFFPECLVKTVETEDNMKIVTLDFGDGCEVRGRFKSGLIIMSYEKDPELQTKTITVTYEDFRVNEKLVEGSHTIVKIRENERGNPQSTVNFEMMVTWDNGDTTSRVGQKVRELLEGSDTRFWSDNVYSIIGDWETIRKNGDKVFAKVISPLRKELACKNIVSGIIDLTKNEKHGALNFGDGECDDIAILTLDGEAEVIEITLRRKY